MGIAAAVIARLIADYEASLPAWGWPNWVIGSHDAPRIAARVGLDQARVAAMLLLTLRGTPTLKPTRVWCGSTPALMRLSLYVLPDQPTSERFDD